MSNPLHSSKTVEWATPQWLFDDLNAEFGFTLDVFAAPDNAKVSKYYTQADDGLAQDWGSNICWMNPPYGTKGNIDKWMAKAASAASAGATVVCLIPARTDTIWWHESVLKADEIRFVKGRIKFGDGKGSATFPSAIVIYRPEKRWPSGSRFVKYFVKSSKPQITWVIQAGDRKTTATS